MRLEGRCRYCGSACQWIRDDAGALTPDWPCAAAPSPPGHCKPEQQGDRMVRQLAERMDRGGVGKFGRGKFGRPASKRR